MLLLHPRQAIYIAATVVLFLSKTTGEEHYFQNINYHAYSNKAADAVQYTAIAVCILFSLASLFGVVGSITQHRKMIALFKVVYWFVAILEFIVAVAAIVIFAVQRSVFIEACTTYSDEVTADDCTVGYRNFMIIFSILLMVVSFIQFYFATAISAYATRLRRTNMHEKLRNLEDFPEPPSKTEFF
ncbi:hypothetical protein INT47_006998 [Mucor saturninus]|uniref:Uncharacterized protein n=1 Tax=Mucor saturninus TaxID=64648 RepID=A0A8H7QM01_9FUNG|nr:hypothetical protein INT47_006998 [Mucor saturninus]